MPQAAARKTTSASLDPLHALIGDDLARVDALILSRIKSDVPLIHEVAQHIIASGGKRIRPALTLIAAQACGYRGDNHLPLATAIEFIHTATLLHDDVVDESKLRRGMPTANETFGNKASVLVGDYLLGQAFQLMVEDGRPKVLSILANAAAIIAKGEVMQLMSEGDLETTQAHYLRVIESKTATLFAAASEFGAVAGGQEKYELPLRDFGMALGTAFQIVDDVLDYSADQQALGKTVGDDFREGKITLPVILAYNAGNEEEQSFWRRMVGERDQQTGDFEKAVKFLSKHQALSQAADLAARYCRKAHEALAALPAAPARDAMADLVDFCASRGY